MTIQRAGTELDYTITYLEMTERPGYGPPDPPASSGAMLLRAEAPPVWYFLALYDAVGRDYAWEDVHRREHDDIARWLARDEMALYTLIDRGWPHGFFLLDGPRDGVCDLTYFGLVPQAVGQGLGGWLLRMAILAGWDRPGTRLLTVNTCTLDHPRALDLYQRHGFVPVRSESRRRVLTRDRDLARLPS